MTTVERENFEFSRAASSLTLGQRHSNGAPALQGFGYFGLKLFDWANDHEAKISRQAYQTLVTQFPRDTRIVSCQQGKRILVRPFVHPGTLTEAYKVARKLADQAGV